MTIPENSRSSEGDSKLLEKQIRLIELQMQADELQRLRKNGESAFLKIAGPSIISFLLCAVASYLAVFEKAETFFVLIFLAAGVASLMAAVSIAISEQKKVDTHLTQGSEIVSPTKAYFDQLNSEK